MDSIPTMVEKSWAQSQTTVMNGKRAAVWRRRAKDAKLNPWRGVRGSGSGRSRLVVKVVVKVVVVVKAVKWGTYEAAFPALLNAKTELGWVIYCGCKHDGMFSIATNTL